ncbi:MAG: hypothetical protein M1816_007444 [Peltula sp. TS41687]|nr:MAG: hypothetical protein M1816_007444 [Peltula sp. TS41687]
MSDQSWSRRNLFGQVRRSPVVEIPMLSRFKRKREDDEESEPMRMQKRPRRDGKRDPEGSGMADLGAMLADRQQRHAGSSAAAIRAASHQKRPDLHETGHSDMSGERSMEDLPPLPSTTDVSQDVVGQVADRRLCTGPSSLTPLQRTIESQFGLEILLKHQELRLIEEELAKCQIAYEQLRRCRLIPYPTTSTTENATVPDDVLTESEEPRLDQGAPWAPAPGVTDGPYTRHYAKWLIPDPMFDGAPEKAQPPAVKPTEANKTVAEGRTTRSNVADVAVKSNSGRARGAPSKKQAASSAGPQAKDKSGSLIIRRSSDGCMVKLACLDCGRGNFSSAQGFINHCRIAHHRGFDSHDAAANACGEPVEIDDAGKIVDDDQGRPAGSNSLIHPLVRSASISHQASDSSTIRVAQWPGLSRRKKSGTASSLNIQTPKKRRQASQPRLHSKISMDPENADPTVFTPSSEVPRLSELLAKTGLGINLGGMVAEANHKFDLTVYSSDEDEAIEEAEDVSKGVGPRRPQQRRPVSMDDNDGATSSTMEPASSSSLGDLAAQQARRSSEISGELSISQGRHHRDNRAGSAVPMSTSSMIANTRAITSTMSAGSHLSPNLSPNTADLNTAPSLVSDDEYEAHSESESPSSNEEHEEVEFEVGDASESTGPADPELTPVGGVKGGMPSRTASRRRREEVSGGVTLETTPTTTRRERRIQRDQDGPSADTDHNNQGTNRSQRRATRDKRTGV